MNGGIDFSINGDLEEGLDHGMDIQTELGNCVELGKGEAVNFGVDVGVALNASLDISDIEIDGLNDSIERKGNFGVNIGCDLGSSLGSNLGSNLGVDFNTGLGNKTDGSLDLGVDVGLDVGKDLCVEVSIDDSLDCN